MLLLLMTIIGWLIDKIQERKAWHPPVPSIPEKDPGCRINHDLWEKHKGCNPTGKYNDIW